MVPPIPKTIVSLKSQPEMVRWSVNCEASTSTEFEKAAIIGCAAPAWPSSPLSELLPRSGPVITSRPVAAKRRLPEVFPATDNKATAASGPAPIRRSGLAQVGRKWRPPITWTRVSEAAPDGNGSRRDLRRAKDADGLRGDGYCTTLLDKRPLAAFRSCPQIWDNRDRAPA